MSLSLHPQVTNGWLAATNPVARLIAASILGLGALAAVDAVTPALLLVALFVALATTSIYPWTLLRRGWPILFSALGVATSNVLLGSATPADAFGLALRVLAVALPGFAVALTVDPTAMADSLVQQARVPARFAYGALAAVRLLPLLSAEWTTLSMARRARGYDDHGLLARLKAFVTLTLAMLVGAIRRGTRLALAMDARGFDATGPRSIARPQFWRRRDTGLVVACVLTLTAAYALSSALGTLRWLGN